jgi:hypothetical protein
MAVVFKQGDQLSKDDLKIFITDDRDRPFDPYSITYTTYNSDKKFKVGQSDKIPIKEDIGYYFVGERINPSYYIGSYYVEWAIKRDSTSPIEIVRQKFAIIS